MARLCDVTLQSDFLRNVVKLEPIMDAPCLDFVWMFGESARGESLMVRRYRNLLVNRELTFEIWKDERLDTRARGLLSLVTVVASRVVLSPFFW